MSHFRLHTKGKERNYLLAGAVCVLLAVAVAGYVAHSIGTARAKSRETVLIYTEEELEQYLLDTESEEYNLNGRYRLEEDLDLGWLYQSIGTNAEPFTGSLDGNGHVISGLTRPLFGVMKRAEVENLFLSGAVIENPAIYSEGEHYVDGYGALAAYAVDSVIRNCGMNGEIYTASPSEAEYLVERADSAERDESRGPGVQEPTTAQEGVTGSEDISGGVNTETSSEPAKGPGIETDGNQVPETDGKEETAMPSEAEKGTTAVDKETEAPTSSGTSGENGSEPEKETIQPTDVTEEGQTGGEEEADTEPEELESEGVKEEAPEPSQEDKADVDKTNADSEPVQNEPASMETVGYQPLNRQRLALKVSSVMEVNVDEYLEASPPNAEETPSMATPSNATDPNEEAKNDGESQPEETELQYIGNPNGDTCILVTADRVTAGGLVAQVAGETSISNSFALVTIGSALEDVEAYTGGLMAILEEGSRTENSYATGLVDSDGVSGGFAAVNEGSIENSYSTLTVGKAGKIRGGFTALGDGSLTGCIYDRQMACVDEEADEDGEVSSSSDAEEFRLKGMRTADMIGSESGMPGAWRKTENAYPQLEYFALSDNETVAVSSRASVIALVLPDGQTLTDIVKNGDIILPPEIDGEIITWEAEGDIRIEGNNQVVSDGASEVPSIEAKIVPTVKSQMESKPVSGTPADADEEEEVSSQKSEAAGNVVSQLKASVGNMSRSYAVAVREETASTSYANWGKVGEAVEKNTDDMGRYKPTVGDGSAENPYQISTPEALAWFAYRVNQGAPYNDLCLLMTKDIDLNGEKYNGGIGKLHWDPIGRNMDTSKKKYWGTVDGGGHAIWNLYTDRAFIDDVNFNGVVKDFGIESGEVNGRGEPAGGIASYVLNTYWLGGTCDARFERCYNKAKITGDPNAKSYAGGIVAIGRPGATIVDCYNEGDIRAAYSAGGIGTVDAQTIANCYNTGNISISGGYSGGRATGIFRGTVKSVSNCYYKSGCAPNNEYGSALSEAQMKTWAFAYLLNGKSVNGAWSGKDGEYPVLGENEKTYHTWEDIGQGMAWGWLTEANPSGNGSSTDPYQITNAAQLGWFAYQVNSGTKPGACSKLLSDIDLSGDNYGWSADNPIRWNPVGTSTYPYTGTFNGNGRLISCMKVEHDGAAGLFGYVGGGAKIQKVSLTPSCSVINSSKEDGTTAIEAGTAGLAGAVVSAGGNVGVTIENCYNRASISGITGSKTGGLVGACETVDSASQKIISSYNTGLVTASNGSPGAIAGNFDAGTEEGTASMKYCAWDSDTAGTGAPAGVTAASTAISSGNGGYQTSGLASSLMKSDDNSGLKYRLNQFADSGTWVRKSYMNDQYPILTEGYTSWEEIGQQAGWKPSSAGSGTEGSATRPYQIRTKEELAWFAYQVNHTDGASGICAELTADISLFGESYTGFAYNPSDLSSALKWVPIGSEGAGKQYTGTFNGNGHTISNIRAEGTGYQGLFGVLGANAAVRNVAVSNSLLNTTGSYAGGIAASIRGPGVTIEKCRNIGKLTGSGDSLGGIIGYVEESGTNASITSCWNVGNITGTGNMAGGIIGEASQADGLVIEACYTTAGSSVTADGKQQVGGILGAMMESGSGSPSYLMTVRNCYNLGSVSGDSHVGGIAGQKTAGAAQVIQGCYNAGTVTSSSGNSRGAMIGNAADTAGISFCYYDKTLWDTIGGGSSGGGGDGIHGTGLSTELLKTWAAAYALNGQSRNQSTGISWTYDPSGTRYPVPAASSLTVPEDWGQIGLGLEEGIMTTLPSGTAWTKPGAAAGTGDGSSGNPYQLGSAEDLAWFAHVVTTNPSVYGGACADLTEPVIDMTGLPYGGNSTTPVLWKPIKSYGGTFGAGQTEVYELTGLHINTTSTPGANAGLFEQVTGTAANIGVVDSQFISSGGSQGAIAGVLDGGTIYQCYARGNVGSGALYTGGIAGQMTGALPEIKDCYNQETQLTAVGTSSAAGGIAGDGSAGTIQNCYHASLSSGSVKAEESAGGTAGSIAGKIGAGNPSHCYSDQILSDSAHVTMFDTSSDKKRLEQTAGLNTTSDGTERKGTDRVWFTSLQAESTRGMPTLKAPVFISADGVISPADQAEGRTISLSSAIPDAKLRAIHQENGSSYSFDLAADVGSKFQIYGKKNANQYLGFAAGNIDLGKVSSSLTQPAGTSLGTVSQLTLYNGAAYTCPDSQTILLDFASGTTRYEVRVELSGVSSKMLSVVLPVKAVLDISPDGSLQTAHSGDIRLVNDNDYPIEGSIESLKLMDGDGYLKLQPVKGDMDWTGRKGQITNMGVKLGIDNLRSGTAEGTGLTPSKLYYTPKDGAAESSWMSYRLKSRGTLWYQYFMEYAADPYYFKEPDKYGYTVKYRFSVAEDDYTSELHAEIGS